MPRCDAPAQRRLGAVEFVHRPFPTPARVGDDQCIASILAGERAFGVMCTPQALLGLHWRAAVATTPARVVSSVACPCSRAFRPKEATVMSTIRTDERGRRTFLKNGCIAAAGVICFTAGLRGAASQTSAPSEDHAATHNMLVVGHDAIFLSHLPMFQGVNATKAAFTSPHRYQVILQAELTRSGKSVDDLYARDRRGNPDVKMYTLNPNPFILSRLFMPDARRPMLKSFVGTVFRGHLERESQQIDGLVNIDVNIKKVVHARMFDPVNDKPDELTYIVFGAGQELFLAHRIAEPPDFDQVVAIKAEGHQLTAEELDRGVEVVFPDRKNVASRRLREGEALSGRGRVAGAHQFLDLRITANVELYLEEGELLVPPNFAQTPEEKKSGF
jgi:hypothetical protein